MPVIDLFSYRKRGAEAGTPDVFVYDRLPEALRVQIIHIWTDAIGPFYVRARFDLESPPPHNNQGWELIHNSVAREHGVFALGQEHAISDRCVSFLMESSSVDAALDLIEASFLYIYRIARDFGDYDRAKRGIKMTADAAIGELNERFRRAGVGYQFDDGRIFRVDSELIHREVVRPVLRYLPRPGFEGPRDEFLQAHAHYRSGETKDAITDANNAFESTLKTICDQRRWQYGRGARASDLLKVVRRNGLLPRLSRCVVRPTGRYAQVRSAEGEERGGCARPGSKTARDARLRGCLRASLGGCQDSVSRRSARCDEIGVIGRFVRDVGRGPGSETPGLHPPPPQPSSALSPRNIVIAHIDQTAESDLHLLRRLARQYDAAPSLGVSTKPTSILENGCRGRRRRGLVADSGAGVLGGGGSSGAGPSSTRRHASVCDRCIEGPVRCSRPRSSCCPSTANV